MQPQENTLIQKIRKLKNRYVSKMRMAETPLDKAIFKAKVEVLTALLKGY